MPPLVAIVGETGTGKTALAIELAKHFNGEIIAADSRTVYTGMDIATAKPTIEERSGIPHYGLDVVEPMQQFTVYDFKRLAESAIESISARGKLPVLVGGTGLYVDALLYNYAFRPKPNSSERTQLKGLSIKELQDKILARHLPLPTNQNNPRHLSRLLESGEAPKQQRQLRKNTVVIGLAVSREMLRERLEKRVDAMLKSGLIEEVRMLRGRYGDIEALRTPGYRAITEYLVGEVTLEEAKRRFVQADMSLAKRQRTWFKRNKDIHWLTSEDTLKEAISLIEDVLDR